MRRRCCVRCVCGVEIGMWGGVVAVAYRSVDAAVTGQKMQQQSELIRVPSNKAIVARRILLDNNGNAFGFDICVKHMNDSKCVKVQPARDMLEIPI